MSVLVVDDNADMRYLARVLLEIDGAVDLVAEAATASHGVAAWREQRPDVVVLDYRMEDGTGLDVARTILQEDPTQPIILFSAFLTDEYRAQAEELGVRECISKDEVLRLPVAVRGHGRPA